jgi:hypothetical protein
MCTSRFDFLEVADLPPVRGFPQAGAVCREHRDVVMQAGYSRRGNRQTGP